MKKNYYLLFGVFMSVITVLFSSCDDDDKYDYDEIRPTALVTVKPNADNTSFVMQLNDSVVLYPSNLKSSPFGTKEVRAFVNYELEDDVPNNYGTIVEVNRIDSILTKQMAISRGEENLTIYGNDPVEVINSWETVVEDGYLTLRFRTVRSYASRHYVNLVASGDEENPFKVTFHHKATNVGKGVLGDSYVAFRLSDLPDTNGETVDLILEWKSFNGVKTAKFKYRTRK
jgi:hypothetical protein